MVVTVIATLFVGGGIFSKYNTFIKFLRYTELPKYWSMYNLRTHWGITRVKRNAQEKSPL